MVLLQVLPGMQLRVEERLADPEVNPATKVAKQQIGQEETGSAKPTHEDLLKRLRKEVEEGLQQMKAARKVGGKRRTLAELLAERRKK